MRKGKYGIGVERATAHDFDSELRYLFELFQE